MRSILSYLDINLSGSGLIRGGHLAGRLEQALGDKRIDDLPIRFAAIATEFNTGHEIWLTRGRLADALRASYALPGIFPPVRIGGRWLVDGALVNPVPVSAARALGARLVIAVNLNADIFGRGTIISDHGSDASDDVPPETTNRLRGMFSGKHSLRQLFGTRGRPGIPTVMVEAFNVMQDRITRARLAGDPPDVLISPRLGHVGWFDFHRAAEAIAIGTEAMEKTIDGVTEAIAALSHPVNANGASRFRADRRKPSALRDQALRRADVVAHCFGFALDFVDALLDHVADRDDADGTSVGHHRHVTEFSRRHPFHDAGAGCRPRRRW